MTRVSTTRGTRRLSLAIVALAAFAVLATGCEMSSEAWDSSVSANNEREARGLRPLDLDKVLNEKAQAWADQMAASGSVRHSVLTQGVGDNWRVLGENVGWARSVQEMHQMFMDSPSHRSTMLDSRYTRFGVGVSVVGDRLYTAQVFAG